MFTNTYLPHVGGVARSVDFFANDLHALGHEVMVIAPTFPEDLAGEPEAGPDKGGPRVLRVPAIQNFNGSDFSVRIPLPFVIHEELDAFAPQIVHSHHPFLLGDTALRTSRQRGLPLVFTHHTMYERYTHYVGMDSDTMQRFVVTLATEYANLCTRVAAPSRSVADVLERRGVETPVREVPTGVDQDFFSGGDGERFRREQGIAHDAPVLGHLGRLAPEKNLDHLARAVAECLERNAGAQFLLCGDGPSLDSVRGLLRKRGVEDRLHWAGVVSGRDLADAYAAMDLFVFSSTSETQGMVLTEAMAAGVPVVALDAPGAREVVQDGENGRLLPAGTDPDAFAAAALKALEHTGQWREGVRNTAEAFSRESCAKRLEAVYQEAVEERAPAPASVPSGKLDLWESIQRAVKTEWELLGQKTAAMVKAVKESKETDEDLQ
jgi:glycosyltransferase involved in cell wall biosynthesis